jgi:hypothetical protein
MSCRAWLVLLACAAACDDSGVVTVEVSARATQPELLQAVEADSEPDDAEHRWDIVLAPAGSTAVAPEPLAAAEFTPDLRGVYVIERWLRYGVGEDLTHRFVVETLGAPPVAKIAGPATVAVGGTSLLDASASASPEQLTLSFTWRLVARPRDSAAMLSTTSGTTTSFVADAPGRYEIEVAVFDGALWSDPHGSFAVSVAAP